MSKTKQVIVDGQKSLKQNKPEYLTKLFDNTSQVLVQQDINSALDWDKHKPLIVEEQKYVNEKKDIKFNPCILNAGVHQCIVRVIKPDKNNKKDKKSLNNNFTSISDQCGNKNKVVGVNIDFYLQHASPVVREALQGLIDKHLIATGNQSNRQYFCHKHLVNIFGVVPRQPNSNILSYNLFACAPFFENEVIATFSSIKFKSDDVELVGKTKNILVSSADFIIDDKCIRDLGDYVTDPRVILLGTTQYNADLVLPEFKWLANKINVKIENKSGVYSLVATKNIQAAPGKKKEIQLFADFGKVYWDKFVENHYKESFHNFRYPLFNFSDDSVVNLNNEKKIYRDNLAKHLLGNFQSDSQQKNKNLLKLNSKRLNTLASLIK